MSAETQLRSKAELYSRASIRLPDTVYLTAPESGEDLPLAFELLKHKYKSLKLSKNGWGDHELSVLREELLIQPLQEGLF